MGRLALLLAIGALSTAGLAKGRFPGPSPAGEANQLDGLSEQIQAAKLSYQEGRLDDALQTLKSTIASLESHPPDAQEAGGGRSPLLAEAQFQLGLCFMALGEEGPAFEAFAEVLRLSPARQLDANVHAPKVIEIFENARTAVENEVPKLSPAEIAVESAQAVLATYEKAFRARDLGGIQTVRAMSAEATQQLRSLFDSLRSVEIEIGSCDVLDSSESAPRLRCLQTTQYVYQGGQQHADERWATFSFTRNGELMVIRNIGDFERN